MYAKDALAEARVGLAGPVLGTLGGLATLGLYAATREPLFLGLAYFNFIINLFKVPFSAGIGVIHGSSLAFDAMLVPAVFAGLFAGRWLIHRVPQRAFDALMLGFAGIAALRLLLL